MGGAEPAYKIRWRDARRRAAQPLGAELVVETLDFGNTSSATVLCYSRCEFPESVTYDR
jgi:hypothetical protein